MISLLEHIALERERRATRIKEIQDAIFKCYTRDRLSRVRRGRLHEDVAIVLNERVNNAFVAEIFEAMYHLKIRKISIHGEHHYSGLKRRKQQPKPVLDNEEI